MKSRIARLSVYLCAVGLLLSPPLFARDSLKMVVTAAFVSQKGMKVYQDIADYVGSKLGDEVKLISGTSYTESDLLLQHGVIQVGFICGLPYTHGKTQDQYRLVAIPVMAGKKGDFPDTPGYEDVPGKYFSYTIVRKDSPYRSWADLKGKSYTFNEQTSNSGYNMPRYKLVQLGAHSWQEYFSRVVVSGSHEESIRLVANGAVDASSVDSMVLDFDRRIGDPDALNVRVIETLFPGGAGIPPVVVSNSVSPALRDKLEQVLTTMHEDPAGRKVLDSALLLRFDPPNDHNYDDVRRMEKAAHDFGFQDYDE